jgi:L-aspartate oxidase
MSSLEEAGYDPSTEPIPVSPAAHYTVGGIVTDLEGRTTLAGLYAAGECAATGVHGANRLASNSLLECLVFGRRAGLAALFAPTVSAGVPPAAPPTAPPIEAGATDELRGAIWRDAGLIRNAAGLEELAGSKALLPRLVAESALARRESRGAHFRDDFPTEDDAFLGHAVLRRGYEPVLERWS